MDLSTFKAQFDTVFATYLQDKIDNTQSILVTDRLQQIIKHTYTLATHNGKRVRPYMVYLAYKSCGGQDDNEVMRFGIIHELLHTMALIHDDIIDEADKRHGVDTIHTYMQQFTYKTNIRQGQAILVGDLLLARTYDLLHDTHHFDNENLKKAQQTIHTMISNLILGQMLDVDTTVGERVSDETIKLKSIAKSADYTFASPMCVGAILAGAPDDIQQQLIAMGRHIGLAYQTYDDLKDLIDGDNTKTTFRDIQEGQQTFFTQYIINHGTDTHRTILQQSLGKDLTAQQIITIKKMLHDSGAIQAGKDHINTSLDTARAILTDLNFSQSASISYREHLINKFAV